MTSEEQYQKAQGIAQRLAGRLADSCHTVYELLLALTSGEVAIYNIGRWATLSTGLSPRQMTSIQEAAIPGGEGIYRTLNERLKSLPPPTHDMRITPVFDEQVRREVSLIPAFIEDEMRDDNDLDERTVLSAFLIYQNALRVAAKHRCGERPVVEMARYAMRFAPEAQIIHELLGVAGSSAAVCNMPGGEA